MPRTGFDLPAAMMGEIEACLVGTETVSQFARRATEEKLRRLQTRDAHARQQAIMRDVEALRPIVVEIVKSMEAGEQ